MNTRKYKSGKRMVLIRHQREVLPYVCWTIGTCTYILQPVSKHHLLKRTRFFSIDRIKVVIGVILEQLDRMGESMVGMSCVRISKTFSAHDQNHC